MVFVNLSQPLLPWGMALAAGAMLFVISDEIIPEIHSGGFERVATFGVMLGFVEMMFLDTTLGCPRRGQPTPRLDGLRLCQAAGSRQRSSLLEGLLTKRLTG